MIKEINGIDGFTRAIVMALALAAAGSGSLAADENAERARNEIQAREAQQKEQLKQHIDRQAQQYQHAFQSALQAELELARKTCASLSADARKKVVAAGNEAVKAVARQFAEMQMTGKGRQGFDARVTIHDAVVAVIKLHAAAEEFAAYERESAARVARRARAARLGMVTKLERDLSLSAAQCAAIEADLEKLWQPDWGRDLFHSGVMINHRRLAPDFADKAIAPHLDGRQRAEWQKWCQEAGYSRIGHGAGWSLSQNSLPSDPWWAP